MLRVSVETGADWDDALAPYWAELVHADTAATPFQSREWIQLWHEKNPARPFVLAVHLGQDLVGIYPLSRQRTPLWPAIRPMGVGPSDYLKPVAQPELRAEVFTALMARLREEPGLVDLHQLPLDDPPECAIEQAKCLILDLPDSSDAYLAGLSKSLRYDIRRLDKDPKVKIREDLDPRQALAILFDLHARRWRSRGLPGSFLSKSRKFHEAWAECATQKGWLRLSVLEYDGNPVGAIYAMAMGGTYYFYQSGFDPAAKSISPGTLLVAHSIRRAIEEGAKVFDFCRGDEPYKRRWKPNRVVTNHRILMAGSALGSLGETWNRMAWRVEDRLRQRLEGGRLWPAGKPSRPTEQS